MADEENDQEQRKTLYHYTTDEGAEGIQQSGVINKSTSERGDAVFGDGTYFTKLPPTESKCSIAENNYDMRTNSGQLEDIVKSGRVDKYVKLDMLQNEVEKCKTPDGRDVYRVPDRAVKLDPKMNPTFGKTGDKQ